MTSRASGTASTTLVVAGMASLGAGAIHAAAIGVHGEHRQAAAAFALLATFQVAWGVLALLRAPRLVIALCAAGNAMALGGGLAARTSGIRFIDGLEDAESGGFAGGAAAALAAVAVAGAVAYLVAPSALRLPLLAGPVPAAAATGVLVIAAIVAAGGDTHVQRQPRRVLETLGGRRPRPRRDRRRHRCGSGRRRRRGAAGGRAL